MSYRLFFSYSNGNRLIRTETARKVEKMMEKENFEAIISNHLLQSPGVLDPITDHAGKVVQKAIESRNKNIPRKGVHN